MDRRRRRRHNYSSSYLAVVGLAPRFGSELRGQNKTTDNIQGRTSDGWTEGRNGKGREERKKSEEVQSRGRGFNVDDQLTRTMNDERQLYQFRDADWLSGNSEHFSLRAKVGPLGPI